MNKFILILGLVLPALAFPVLNMYTLADKNVTTAGTRVRVYATDLFVHVVTIQAKKANTGKIYVGDSAVSSSQGHQLEAGESYVINGMIEKQFLEQVNLKNIWIDSSANGEGVHISYIMREAQ